jgi:hypothetical protein
MVATLSPPDSMFVIEFFGSFCVGAIIAIQTDRLHATLKSVQMVCSYIDPSLTLFVFSLIIVLYYFYAPTFPTMNPHEVVDHIRSGPTELVIDELLHFRGGTHSNPCDFNEFLLALQSSETIRTVRCGSHLELGISEKEWVLLIKTLGMIKGVQLLRLYFTLGSSDFHPFQAVAEAVNNAHSLRELYIGLGGDTFPKDSSGLIALANALRDHATLDDFTWTDLCPRPEAAQEDTPDFVLRALPACPHHRKVTLMTKCASADATKNLLQLQSVTELRLVLPKKSWLVVADEIRRGRCNVQRLTLSILQVTISEATEAVKAVASAIQLDCNLEHLHLQMENGFTDEAGVALAEALTVNKTLRMITLSVQSVHGRNVHNKATLGAQSYEAFCAMLRINTSLVLKLPVFETTGADARLLEWRDQLHIEYRLNIAGRGKLLASSQTAKDEWVDALDVLNAYNVDDSPAFQISCLYSLLRLHPAACMSQLTN